MAVTDVKIVELEQNTAGSRPSTEREYAYRTKDGDVLDHIAWRYYGSLPLRSTEAIMERNPWLAYYPPHLPAGLTLILPVLDDRQSKVAYLWDRNNGSNT